MITEELMGEDEALALLNLEPGLLHTEREIHTAYKRLALLHHPDKNKADPVAATATFQLVAEAYNALLEIGEDRRAEKEAAASAASSEQPDAWGAWGSVGSGGAAAGGTAEWTAPNGAETISREPPPIVFEEDEGGDGDLVAGLGARSS